MKTIREKLPDIESLDVALEKILEGDLPNFLSATEDVRTKVKESFLFILMSVAFLIALFTFFYLSDLQDYTSWSSKFILMLSLLWATVLLVSGRTWFSSSELLAREMNMALVPVFSDLFNRTFLYTHNVSNVSSINKLLKQSSLMTEEGFIIKTDDSYQVFGDYKIDFHELVITLPQPVKGSNKPQNTEIFKGLFMVAELPKKHDAETYITTDGDRSGFADRDFWSDLLEHGDIKETVLEWNDFEDTFHIATNDPAKAREVLTPDFMQDLHSWWGEHKLNIRIAFKENKLYLLMPETSLSISTTTTSKKASVIKKFATSLARPMWRGFLLVEDASK